MGKKFKNGQVVDTASDGTIYPSSTALLVADATKVFTQTYSTTTTTVPAVTAATPPAGGTGAAAGGWDTAGHRDSAIASLTAAIADTLANRKLINLIIDALQLNGLAG